MTPLQTNKPVFFDGDTPLNGTIYVGQPGTDPRTNPKTVTLQDSGGAQFAATQPLVVLDGKVVYNGKPIVALVDGEFSALIFDGAGRQVDYIRAYAPAEGGSGVDFSEVTRTGLTLTEIKGYDAAVGDTLENVGLSSAEDGRGGKWLVKSSTGSAGDDVFLIDLDNGLQAMRIDQTGSYPKLVWSGSQLSVPLSALDDGGSGLYVVEAGGYSGIIPVNVLDSKFSRGLINVDLGSGFLAVTSVRFSGPTSQAFTAVTQEINNITTSPATSETNLNITAIYKV